MCPSNSTRWCPTPEQVMILEEMYKGGMRTPNASQIQKITAHLSFYGKIEGKNVFYWFQNHKARERQKLRRKLSKQLYQQQLLQEQLSLYNQSTHNYRENAFFGSNVSPDSSALHQLSSFYKSADIFLGQDGGISESTATANMKASCTWKRDHHPATAPRMMYEMQQNMNSCSSCCCMMRRRSFGGDDDWTMMMMRDHAAAGPTDHYPSRCCSTNSNNIRPLKTLQLFPITTSQNLNVDHQPSSSMH